MRIIAGEFRRRLLQTPPNADVTRPIPDRVKESLFSLLRGHCEGATVFDAFAGTGAIGLEALSRGAAKVVFVERDRGVAEILRANIASLHAEDRCELFLGDALGAGARARAPRPLTLAFLDPPYPLVEDAGGFRRVMEQLAALIDLLTDDGFAVLRTPWPLRHAVGEPSAIAPTATPAPGRRFKKPRRDRWRADEPERAPREPRPEPEAEDIEPEPSADPAAPTPPKVEADMHLPNAVGPETHTYHQMAVHLYMRKRA